MSATYELFLESVDGKNRDFVEELHALLTAHGCKCEVKSAKSGYVVSYVRGTPRRTVLNYVFRKTGMKARVYAEHVGAYEAMLASFPDKLKSDIKNASPCKRLMGEACSPTCPMGYTFTLDGETYKKCRSMAFLVTLSDDNDPFIRALVDSELKAGEGA